MESQLHEKCRSPLKLIVKSVFVLLLLPFVVVSTDVNTVPHRTWEDFNSDPCTFTTFLGDESLLEKGHRAVRTMLLEEIKKIKASIPHQEDPDTRNITIEAYRQQLQIAANYLLKMMEVKAAAFISPCQQKSNNQCRLEKSKQRKEIKRMCEKLRRVKMQMRRLKEKDFEQQNVMGKLQLEDTYSFKINTSKQTVSRKQNSFTSTYKWIHTRKAESAKSHSMRKRAAIANKSRLWDDGVIPYEIDDVFSVSSKEIFKRAMRKWENYTCIIFKEKGPEDQNNILFTNKPACGCCSLVGKAGRPYQNVSLAPMCIRFGIVLHELGHAIGFYHEHSRPDRDNYVEIIHTNIEPGKTNKL